VPATAPVHGGAWRSERSAGSPVAVAAVMASLGS
jgi:hypothetical protein